MAVVRRRRRHWLVPTLTGLMALEVGVGGGPSAAPSAPPTVVGSPAPSDLTTAVSSAASPSIATRGRLINVPADVPTLEAAIVAARPGDVILLAAGTYRGGVTVPREKHDLVIRGADRNGVILDGKDVLLSGIEVKADRVTIENLTARHYTGNGFEWEGVDGFSGRFLTVSNVGLYGIYAIESRHGSFQEALVSGAADSAFYVGECHPCDTLVSHVTARFSAIGYSGTNAGGNLELRDSLWDRNGTGILPNSYEGQEAPPPERETRITGNTVRDSGALPTPAHSPLAGFVGLGIGIAGGLDNVVERNSVTGSARFGIALFPTLQKSGNVFAPGGNQVRGNTVSGSGLADLALSTGSGPGNCFAGNTFGSSLPAAIEARLPCEPATASKPQGDRTVGRELAIPIPEALDRLGKRPDYTTMPEPEPADSMPDPIPRDLRPFHDAASVTESPPAGEASSGLTGMAATLVAVVVVVVVVVVGAAILIAAIASSTLVRRRRRRPPSR